MCHVLRHMILHASFHNIFSSRSFMNEAMMLAGAFTCILRHKTQIIKTLSIHYIGPFFMHNIYKVHEAPLIYLLTIA